jgi:gamma-glutamyltranspeptidase
MDGGNAVDAAVATALCLGVANPASSGLGGGAFILVHSDRANHEAKSQTRDSPKFHDARDPNLPVVGKDKITEVIDCRETAPKAATQDMFSSKPVAASSFGGLAVAVPGELRGLELAHARHGKLPWADVVKPAEKLAREGIPISQHLARDIKSAATEKTKQHGEFPGLRSYLTKNDNWDSYPQEGELLKNPKLAETLQLVSEVGSKGFYEGELAKSLVKEVEAEGGILSVDDMVKYLPTLRSPVSGVASGFTLVGVPPPSSGGATVIGAARFLSGFESPLASSADTLAVHRMVEALRHAFAIRMSLSDPDFFTNMTIGAVQDLISGPYMESLRKMTLENNTLPLAMYGGKKWAQLHNSDGKANITDAHEGDRRLRKSVQSSWSRRLARPFGYLEDSGTSHLSVVDKDGNAVAITSSVNQIFGSYVFSESTGVLLGNTMDGESWCD